MGSELINTQDYANLLKDTLHWKTAEKPLKRWRNILREMSATAGSLRRFTAGFFISASAVAAQRKRCQCVHTSGITAKSTTAKIRRNTWRLLWWKWDEQNYRPQFHDEAAGSKRRAGDEAPVRRGRK